MGTLSPVLRDASPSEDAQIAVMFHNAFLPVWNHNWFANAKVWPPPIPLASVSPLPYSARSRLLFYASLISSVRLSNGLIRVLATPSSTPDEPDEILACCMWTRPHEPLSSSVPTLLKSGFVRLAWNWGWTGIQRVAIAFEGTNAKLQEAAWAKRKAEGKGGATADAAYLQMIAVREDVRGKGLAGILVKDGLERFQGELVMLDATEEGPRRLYEYLGFETVGEGRVGQGECDKDGLPSGEPKDGGPIFAMLHDGTREDTYRTPASREAVQ